MIAFILSLVIAMTAPDARVVEIHAKRFSFTPDAVTLRHGERLCGRGAARKMRWDPAGCSVAPDSFHPCASTRTRSTFKSATRLNWP